MWSANITYIRLANGFVYLVGHYRLVPAKLASRKGDDRLVNGWMFVPAATYRCWMLRTRLRTDYDVYDRPFRTVVCISAFPFTSSWIEALQLRELDESPELGFVVRNLDGSESRPLDS